MLNLIFYVENQLYFKQLLFWGIIINMYMPYQPRQKPNQNRSKSPKADFFRNSLKSKQDLSFLKHRQEQHQNELKVRQTINRPQYTKYTSHTVKNQERGAPSYFKTDHDHRNRYQSSQVDWSRVNQKKQAQGHHGFNYNSSFAEQKQSSQNIKPTSGDSNNQYQKLHDKLNYLQTKITQMKSNLQKKREQKKKYFQKQIKQREKITEKQYKNTNITTQQVRSDPLKQVVSQVNYKKNLKPFAFDPYSPRHNTYYVSEVVRAYKQQNSIAREHLVTSIQLLKMLSRSRMPGKQQMNAKMVKLTKKQIYQGNFVTKIDKKTIVFDLDQTLIHCNENANMPCDVKLPIKFPTGQVIYAGINIRPHAVDLLKQLSKNFEVIVFTASHSCYANVVLNYLDPENKYIAHRLFREHCYYSSQGVHVKDLRVMNRDLSQTVLIDNAAYSYAYQIDNGIPIIPYYQGKNDFELKALQTYLQSMVFCKDVRQVNRNIFKLSRYPEFDTPQALVKQLYSQQLK